jgi:hypothetical protein
MLWKFRAVNNRIAKRRYYMYSSLLILLLIAGFFYRVETGTRVGKAMILFAVGIMFIFLYTVIALGRERYYYMDEEEIVYKPLKTKIKDISGFEVDKNNKLIRLNLRKKSIFSVKTLYFDNIEDLREAEYFLKRYTG